MTTWTDHTPTSGYEQGERCLGMLLSDNCISIPEIERRIARLFPERISARVARPLLPLFNCCGSEIVPQFNDHPDTTEADVAKVLEDQS